MSAEKHGSKGGCGWWGAPSLLRPDPQSRSAAGSRVGASPGRRNVFNSLPFSLLSRKAAWGGWAFAQRGRTAPQEVGAPRQAPIFRNPTNWVTLPSVCSVPLQ